MRIFLKNCSYLKISGNIRNEFFLYEKRYSVKSMRQELLYSNPSTATCKYMISDKLLNLLVCQFSKDNKYFT